MPRYNFRFKIIDKEAGSATSSTYYKFTTLDYFKIP